MQLSLLGAEHPLVKTFTQRDGVLQKSPYPNAYHFTSQTLSVTNITEFHGQLVLAAKRGQCLLKGVLKRELTDEPRASTTDAETPTEWVCLDIDGLRALSDVPSLMHALDLDDVSHIIQYSASMGVDPSKGLSAHVFFMLSAPVAAPFLKQWLIGLNLTHDILRAEIALTRTGNALRWPLDITTCQNDKLIYIAPPHLGPGVLDSFKGKRIQLVERTLAHLPTQRLVADINKNRTELADVLNTLRKDASYAKIKDTQYKVKNNIAYLAKPGEAVITGVKQERGFTYFNLNGGDSWGYYHADNNPEFILNFKGEPAYRTEELLPDYWSSLQRAHTNTERGLEYFVLRDFKTDRLYNGYYDKQADEVVIARAANETRLRSFLKQHGQPVPDFVPDWELTYDPKSTVKYDPDNKRINLYRPSEYFKLKPRIETHVPKLIKRVIQSAVGTGVVYEHFLNWLAFIIQYREPTTTAWVLTGNEGTGKGILFHRILTPILGMQNISSMLMNELEQQFTGWLETSLLVFVDEVQLSQLANSELAASRLRNWIVEPFVEIRRMQTEKYRAVNHANFIFASNKPDPVILSATDRRHNVGEFQEKRLDFSDEDVEAIAGELEPFFHFLRSYRVNRKQARAILETEDRVLLKSINRTSVDEIADAILAGNLEYLLDQLPSSSDPIFTTPGALAYRNLIDQLLLNGHDWTSLSRDELFIVYDYCVGNTPRSPNKFTSMLKHHRLHTKRCRRGTDLFYGIPVDWQHDKAWFDEKRTQFKIGVLRENSRGTVTPLSKKRG